MGRYAIRRLLIAIPVLLLVSILAASLIRLAPGDAVIQRVADSAGGGGAVTPEVLAGIRADLGLDRPFHIQYLTWIGNIFKGDLGNSFSSGNITVASIMKQAVPVTVELALLAIIISLLVAFPIGIWSAIRQDSLGDYGGRLFAIGGLSVPDFIIGSMVILFGAIWLNWTPPLTYEKLWVDPLQNLYIMITPAAILGVRLSSITMRMLRSSMLEVMRQDYIRTAWSKGLHERSVIVRHALKNAFIPVITIVGGQFGFLVGGVVIIESIFNLPGLGFTTINSIRERDLQVLQTAVLMFAFAHITINLLVDLSYGWFDPRIRYQ